MQKLGHKPIVLLGGATTQIGDPSGKDEARQLLSLDAIEENKKSLKEVFAQFIKFGDAKNDAIMVDNNDWLKGKGFVEMLRDVGRYFTVNRILTFDSVRMRLEREEPLTFLEFSYMLLQGYDFTELHKLHIVGCKWVVRINGVIL